MHAKPTLLLTHLRAWGQTKLNRTEPKNCRNVNEKSKKIGKIVASTNAKGQKEKRERVREGRGSTHNSNAGRGGRGDNKRGEMSDWQSKSLKSRKNQGKW